MIIGLSTARKPLHNRVSGLATQLGCRTSDLIWDALERYMQNPPKAAPAGATANTGTSPGFWILHTPDASGKPNGVRVVEVEARNQIAGGDRTFIRFKEDDTGKSRERAAAQAVRIAKYDLTLMGITQEVSIEQFDPEA